MKSEEFAAVPQKISILNSQFSIILYLCTRKEPKNYITCKDYPSL